MKDQFQIATDRFITKLREAIGRPLKDSVHELFDKGKWKTSLNTPKFTLCLCMYRILSVHGMFLEK